jgi:uncharacterized protein YqjF (DUF2071 family)
MASICGSNECGGVFDSGHDGAMAQAPTSATTPTTAARVISASCTDPVRRASMLHGWHTLTFLHWRYDPAVIQSLLPPGLKVETFDGSAWVGLVPFEMRVTAPRGQAVPWVSNFPETNVRTYATAEDGSSGVWFLSLDAARLGAVVVARTTYRLPYFWSKMHVSSVGPIVTYRSRRWWPGPFGASSAVAIEVGEPFAPDELGDLDHWLTARWRLYSARREGLRFARADHPPWPLHRARVVHLDDHLIEAAGLPAPDGEPLVHWSPGVDVRIGFPNRLRTLR